MKRTRLKGGSLSGTYLIEDGDNKFVRKEVSLSENREYGFQRWYSQLKRMQRYSVLYPYLFPKILKYGKDGDMAYFDMEYIEGSMTAHEYLMIETDMDRVEYFLNELIPQMEEMHFTEIASNTESMELYVHEEVDLRLEHCYTNGPFNKFLEYDTIIFNGEEVPSFRTQLAEYKEYMSLYKDPVETFTHGNLTLENILYIPDGGRIIFIDPYEENIIDSSLADYSQLLQSCNSKYELYNAGTPVIDGNNVSMQIDEYPGLNFFNQKFDAFLHGLDANKYSTVKLLEISQFIRMLPFKMVVDDSKMIFFYSLASKLFSDFKKTKI